ncbi:MAG: hypothetical protein BWY26_00223 [Elusimicrobia bacterium ADurb.Bin231]|nr:MAG: hypothetical protein BWY26_00223 [Elusimicrobia bacterium ADurb.Bin231]
MKLKTSLSIKKKAPKAPMPVRTSLSLSFVNIILLKKTMSRKFALIDFFRRRITYLHADALFCLRFYFITAILNVFLPFSPIFVIVVYFRAVIATLPHMISAISYSKSCSYLLLFLLTQFCFASIPTIPASSPLYLLYISHYIWLEKKCRFI